jgi:hypothetical protein
MRMNLNLFHNCVRDMLGAFKGIGTLNIFSDGEYVDGEVVSTKVSYQVEQGMFDFPQANAGDKSRFGTLILSGDKYCIMRPVNQTDPEATPPVIKANRDTITIDNVEWKIFALKTVNPSGINGNDFLFEFHLRK